MSVFLTLAYLFFIGSILGWLLELLFRNLTGSHEKLVNPGFCTGPYLPIYGFGLCVLYLLASLEKYQFIEAPVWNKVLLFVSMALCMTGIEYVAGAFCLKYFKVRLWDYSDEWGNINGIICPKFSAAWSVLGAIYYFLIHPHILKGLNWLSHNLGFSFVIGMFFGIFMIDVAHSANLVVRLKQYAEENEVIIKYEELKAHIRAVRLKSAEKYNFFRPFQSDRSISVILKEMHESLEKHIKPLGKK